MSNKWKERMLETNQYEKLKSKKLKELDEIDKATNGIVELTYKQFVKYTLHALELFLLLHLHPIIQDYIQMDNLLNDLI